jgi:S1-C subfamily serine protease
MFNNKGKSVKTFLKIITVVLFIFLFASNLFVNVINYQAITVVIQNQALFLQLQVYFNELNVERNLKVKETVEDITKKPSFEYLKSVTVRVLEIMDKGKIGTGTGTIVKVTDDYTYILTNAHMAPTVDSVVMVQKDGILYKTEIIKIAMVRDLALLRVTGKIPNTNVVKGFAKAYEQDRVYSVGMYLGLQDIYTEGTVAGWEAEDQVMNLPSLNGCSGSGVFDKDGNLVAVVFAGNAYNFFAVDTAKAVCVPFIGVYAFLEDILSMK